MSMIGVIVDGEGDYAALRSRYGGAIRLLKTDGPRGHTVTEEVLAAAAKKQVAMLVGLGCKKIAVLTDFEGRSKSAEKFCQRAAVHAKTVCGVDVIFLVADQMIENWYLADIAHVSKQKNYLKDVRKQRSYESMHGKKELKKLFKGGYDYHEIRHGAEIFPLVRGDDAAKMSSSFNAFREALGLT